MSDILPSVREAFKLAVKDAAAEGKLGRAGWFIKDRAAKEYHPVCPLAHATVRLGGGSSVYRLPGQCAAMETLGISGTEVESFTESYDNLTGNLLVGGREMIDAQQEMATIALNVFENMFPEETT